jgi:hypothetical protein
VSHVAVGISNSTWQKRLQAVRLYVQDLVWNALERIPQPRVELTLLDVQGLEKSVDLSTVECVVEWGGKEMLRVYPEGSHPDGDSVRPSTKGNSVRPSSNGSRGAPDRGSGESRSSNRSAPAGGKVEWSTGPKGNENQRRLFLPADLLTVPSFQLLVLAKRKSLHGKAMSKKVVVSCNSESTFTHPNLTNAPLSPRYQDNVFALLFTLSHSLSLSSRKNIRAW